MSKPLTTIQTLFEEEIFIKGMRQTSAGRALSETRKKTAASHQGNHKNGRRPFNDCHRTRHPAERFRPLCQQPRDGIQPAKCHQRNGSHPAALCHYSHPGVCGGQCRLQPAQKPAESGCHWTRRDNPSAAITPASPISTNPASMTMKRKLLTRGRKCLAWRKRFILAASCRYWE